MSNSFQQLKGITIATIFFFGLLYVQAWAGPTGTPPANNVEAPVNVGGASQLKSGALGIDGLLRAYNDFIVDGILTASGTLKIPKSAGLGKVLTSDATGNASWQTPPSFSASGSGMTEAELLGRPAWPSSISCGDDPNRVLFKIRTSSPTLVMYYNTQSGYTLYFNNSGLLTAIYAPALTATYGPCVANTSTIESLNDQGRSSTGAGGGISSIAGGNCGVGKVVKSISSIGVATCVTDATGSGGDDLGNHTATQNLTMGNYFINLGPVNFTDFTTQRITAYGIIGANKVNTFKFSLFSSNKGNGKVLVSNAAGDGDWSTASTYNVVPVATLAGQNPSCTAVNAMTELYCSSACHRWCRTQSYVGGNVVEIDVAGGTAGCMCSR